MSRQPIICVVDDDNSVRRALARLLTSYGLGVATFASAPEFLASTERDTAACLIVDVHLERMSGFDLLAVLGDPGGALPAIVMTAHDDEAIRAAARKCQAIFIRKPFESDTLLEALGQAIGRDFGVSDGEP
jgi:FixJ family two-component response regulator